MRPASRSLCLPALALAMLLAFLLVPVPGASAQAAAAVDADRPSRITAPVTDRVLSPLKGNVHPLAVARYDRGAAPATMATGRMMLLLRRSDAQNTALHHYLDDLQNPASPRYRQWLTPASYGASYGISDADLATVSAWLTGQGFKIERVPAARNLIVFSGTVGAIQTAFHTAIHSYVIDGKQHYANNADPQIPTALTPVVAGISPMNDFHARPDHRRGTRGVFDAETGRIRPDLTLENQSRDQFLFVDPADAATIYNTPNSLLNRNYSATRSLDGTGVTIGILGYSDLVVNDVENYRTAFLNQGFEAYKLNLVVDGTDPGIYAGDTAVEAVLDTEIAGALAPGAAINYYTAGSNNFADGLTLAALRALDDNQISILSVSYGSCEASLGADGNLQYSELWQQAAAQGISVVVSSGDSGSAACDDQNAENVASQGLAVSGIASTPYDIAVGGTDFDDLASSFSTYVNTASAGSAPYYGTAVGYIPEFTWNNSVETDGILAQNSPYRDSMGDTNIVAAGGGMSSAAYCRASLEADGNCSSTLTGYPKPAFQTSVAGSDAARDIPDIAFFSANEKYQATWVLCSDSSTDQTYPENYINCQGTNGVLDSGSTFDGIGGTSASAPAFAGILALVSQSVGGERLGQANTVLYNLAKSSSASKIFHAVQGNNSVPCLSASLDCNSDDFLSGYDTASLYSKASGLGSLDVTALVNAWPSVEFTSTATSLTAGTSASTLGTGSISVSHGTPLYFGIAVTPVGAAGTVSVTNTSGVVNNSTSMDDIVTLNNNGAGSFSSNSLPGGSYTVSAYYAGDATHTASTSTPPIHVTIEAESSSTALSLQIYDPSTGRQVSGTTVPYGYYQFLNAQPYGNSSPHDSNGSVVPDGIPSGTVTFFLPYGTSVQVNSKGFADVEPGSIPGTYTLQATYNGDASFLPSMSNTIPLTITVAPTTLSLQPSSTSVQPNGSVTVVATLQTDSIGDSPSGLISLTVNGNSVTLNSLNDGRLANGTEFKQATYIIPASQLVSGSNTLSASYPADYEYAASTATTTVTVSSTAPAPSFTLTGPSSGITIAAPGQTSTGAITLTPANGFTGAVTLACSVTAPASGVAPTCSIPATETISGSSAVTTTLSISTTAGTAENRRPLERFFLPGGGIALGSVLLLALPRRRRGLLALLMVAAAGLTLSGCGGTSGSGSGGGGGGTPGTPAGAYTVTVTGTGSSLSAKTTVTVTVQ